MNSLLHVGRAGLVVQLTLWDRYSLGATVSNQMPPYWPVQRDRLILLAQEVLANTAMAGGFGSLRLWLCS